MASADLMLGETHAIWYKFVLEKPGGEDSVPVYSMLPDESVGKNKLLGYAIIPDKEADAKTMYDIVSTEGEDDFRTTYGKFRSDEDLVLSEVVSCLGSSALHKIYLARENIYTTVLKNVDKTVGLDEKQKAMLHTLEKEEVVEAAFLADAYRLTRTLIQSNTPMRLGIMDGQHRLFALTCLMTRSMPSAANAIKMVYDRRLPFNQDTPWIWRNITATTYCSTAFDDFRRFCDWAQDKSVQIQSSLAKAIVRTVGNVIVDCVRKCAPSLFFDSKQFFSQKNSTKEKLLDYLNAVSATIKDFLANGDNKIIQLFINPRQPNQPVHVADAIDVLKQNSVMPQESIVKYMDGKKLSRVNLVLFIIVRFIRQFVYDNGSLELMVTILENKGIALFNGLPGAIPLAPDSDADLLCTAPLFVGAGTVQALTDSVGEVCETFLVTQWILTSTILSTGRDRLRFTLPQYSCPLRKFCTAATVGKDMLEVCHKYGFRLHKNYYVRLFGKFDWMQLQTLFPELSYGAVVTESTEIAEGKVTRAGMKASLQQLHSLEDDNDSSSLRYIFLLVSLLMQQSGLTPMWRSHQKIFRTAKKNSGFFNYDPTTTVDDFRTLYAFDIKGRQNTLVELVDYLLRECWTNESSSQFVRRMIDRLLASRMPVQVDASAELATSPGKTSTSPGKTASRKRHKRQRHPTLKPPQPTSNATK
jgi:hypothetical protein